MVTIKDIARESGYSVSTVSRVLNNRRDVSPDAKKKIEEIVAAHHFVPNNNARHMRQMVSRTIAVLVKGTSNLLFASIVEEIQSIVEGTRYTLSVSYLDEEANEVEQAQIVCRERNPMGILFLGGNLEYFQEGFGEVEVPCVLVSNQGRNLPFSNLSSVSTDDRAAAGCAVDYLIGQGHRRIGIIGGDLKLSYTSVQRFRGCMDSFRSHGVEFDEKRYFEKARFSYDSAYRAMKRLLGRCEELTAVFAMGDVMAIGAIRALRDLGLMVPEDISVMGFDGITLAEYYNPKLATIQQQYQKLASRSLELLLKSIDLNTSAVHEIVPFQLLEGESVRNITEQVKC
ncbi:MAG: LacI family transcriptional regulator [Lachnospiraceae bacterium]|nr:LacI family transcriptional regulator [Lachnospiraceae bacterium]MCI9151315.1 LacI family transcriptional regulator [Lachnospiraceae bacterium]